MFCYKCGTRLEDDAQYCYNCGTILKETEAPAAPAPEAPVYAAPVPEAPVYEVPVPEAPVYEAPAFTSPVTPAYIDPQPAEEGSKFGRVASLVSLLCGIFSLVFCWIPFFVMEVPSIAAVAFGIVGIIKKGSKGKCITGIILGGIAFLFVLIIGVVWAAAMETNYHF